MVTLGVDAHKRVHTAVAVDELGRRLAERTVAATSSGDAELLVWGQQWSERIWALEDCRGLSRRLSNDLLVAGERVVRVPPKLTADNRRSARTSGKSDPIDALAVARAAQREPDLPTAQLDGPEREVRLLVDHRDDLVAERTRLLNRLRWYLHELQIGVDLRIRSLRTLRALQAQLATCSGLVARLARESTERCLELTVRIERLESEIARLVRALAPTLLALHGCGTLSAAKIVGEVGGISRFRSRAAFARHNGTAPIPVWSGNQRRVRLNRGGNRQINCALHRIAITQMQRPGPGVEYVARRCAAGHTKREALRALRRRLSDEVYQRLRHDELHRRDPLPQAA